MKNIKKIVLIILVSINSIANETSVLDNTHKSIVNTLDENVDVLPKSIQGTAKNFVDDIDKDGKNINFVLKLTNVEFRHEPEYVEGNSFQQRRDNTLFATAGIMLLPNTWKINFSYTGAIAENILYSESTRFDTSNSTVYVIDDGKKDPYWIDFYVKPISTSFGDFGFGYINIEQTRTIKTNQMTLLDYANNSNTGALTLYNQYIRYLTKSQQYHITYNIPFQNKWYDGFGFSYMLEKTNVSQIVKDGMVLRPDGTSNLITFGINKTLDEINTGFTFQTLKFGIGRGTYDYYDHNLKSNQSYTSNYNEIEATLLYMFKPKKDKKYYFSFKGINRQADNYLDMEIKIELGLIF